MKRLIYLFITVFAFYWVSCSKMYDNIEEYAGEIVYPASFDTIFGRIGYERVEIDLMKVGRLPSRKLSLGKATRTIVEYDGKPQLTIDSVCSWVNITGLSESKLYRFKIYTEDSYGNYSVPKEIALIPYTRHDVEVVSFASPKLNLSPSSLVAEWPNGLNTSIYKYTGLSYSYTDKNGDKKSGSTGGERFYCGNLEAGQDVSVDVTYRIIPIVDEVRILDTVEVTRAMEVEMPSASTPFSPSERVILVANGITTFTSEAVASVKKLTLPLHLSTFADLFYFPNLEELDLTGQGLKDILPMQSLSGNGASISFGGGDWLPFMRRIEYTEVLKADIKSIETLTDLLESGAIKKITYIKSSMSLDTIFKPYVANGVVQHVPEAWFPESSLLDPRFLHGGEVVTNSFFVNLDLNRYAPVSEVPSPEAVNNPDKVYKIIPRVLRNDQNQPNNDFGRNATFSFTLPRGYMYDFDRYRYVKVKVYIKGGAELNGDIINGSGGAYRNYRVLWPRVRYTFWGSDDPNNPYGNGDGWEWKPGWQSNEIRDKAMYTVPYSNVNTSWYEVTMDMQQVKDRLMNQDHDASRVPAGFPRKGHYHSRNLCINLGAELGSNPNPHNPATPIVYYFADFRLSKTP